MRIAMSEPEIDLLGSLMTPMTRYLEFGAGGSTIFALDRCEFVTSIDSHPDWLKAVRASAGEKASKLRTIRVDIGAVKDWGYPIDNSNPDVFTRYYTAGNDQLCNTDLVLIDGRFRVACLAQIVASGFKGPILFHDYRDRPWYHEVEKVATPVKKADTLFAFRALDPVGALDLVKKYATDPQ